MPQHLSQVDKELEKVLATDNQLIAEPLARLIGAGGKRLRPTLVIATAASGGKKINKRVIAGCVAVELVHLGSLVHDDIIDNSFTRWNVPTINAKEGPNHAVIIGDYLFSKACSETATLGSEAASLVASTIARLCDGESRELGDRHNKDRSIESLLRAIDGKTAALFSASCQIGGLCAGLDADKIAALGQYGHQLGVAFQLIDDLLDFLSTPKLMGKPVGSDVAEGTYTMPLLLALSGPNSNKVRTLLANRKASCTEITEILLNDGSIEKTILEIKKYNRSAGKALGSFNDTSAKVGLKNLPDVYLNWSLSNLIAKSYRPTVAKFIA